MAPRIVTTGSSWVEPAGPMVSKIITCSATENQCAQVYPTAMWFFANNKNTKDPMAHYALLKKGMARMLYQQPIISGTLQQDDRGAYSVEIPPAPRAGARFHYRDLRHDSSFPTFQQLQQSHFPVIDTKHDGLDALVPEDFPTSAHGDPVFLAQLTAIRGGIIVSASWTHLIGDLIQPRISAVNWAEQTKLVADAEAAGLPEPALPAIFPDEVYDRTRLLPHIPHLMSFEEVNQVCERRGDMFMFDPTNPDKTAELMATVFPTAHLKENELCNEDDLRMENGGTVTFPLKSLQKLQAIAQAGATKKLSTVNVIIAFIWQRFYVAKYALDGTTPDATEELKQRCTSPGIIFPADIRARMNPPLPQGFLGAAVDLFKAEVTAQSLVPENASEAALSRSLGTAATALRDANESWSEDFYMELLRLFQATPVSVPFLPKGPIDFLVTDHTRNAPFRTANFGAGMEVCSEYRQPYMGRDMPLGEVTVMPRLANGDVHVMITAEQITMQRLFQDKLLNQFAVPLYLGCNLPKVLAAKKAAEFTQSARL